MWLLAVGVEGYESRSLCSEVCSDGCVVEATPFVLISLHSFLYVMPLVRIQGTVPR